MTNREILLTPHELLHELDRHRQFLLQVEGTDMPCPACKERVNVFTAAGIDLDEYDFGHTQHSYKCPHCQAELEQAVPFITGSGHLWHWELKHSWLQDQLRKARAFEAQTIGATP